jgi:glycosyltransferase involved in cell wall biosynthesis
MMAYNHEKYIEQALDSILMQSVNFNYEIVIGEDCSTDNTRSILLSYKEKHPEKIKLLLHDKNIGAAKNQIEVFSNCTGKYIAMLEGDDYWTDPLKLQKQVDFLETNPDYVMTYSRAQVFNDEGLVEKTIGAQKDLTQDALIKTTGINTLTVCFRNVIKEFPKEMYLSPFGDLFLWSLLGHYGKGKFLGDIQPAMYRIHEGGVFSLQDTKRRQEMWLNTSFALYLYYNRIGNGYYANYFQGKYFKVTFNILGYKEVFNLIFKHLVYRSEKLIGKTGTE